MNFCIFCYVAGGQTGSREHSPLAPEIDVALFFKVFPNDLLSFYLFPKFSQSITLINNGLMWAQLQV